jgi:predicted alpha/beta hydrolase family esterase
MRFHRLFQIVVGLLWLCCAAAMAQQAQPISVPRYDDADEYLPAAEKKNSDKVRLYLRQQPGEETLTAISERNVSIKVIAKVPEGAHAGVVLLVGGNSVLSIGPDDKLDRSFNFISRTRDHWWSLGFATFLVDAPSDHLDKVGMTAKFRASKEFAVDMQAVAALISKRFDKPLHAVGHSNGAIAVAAVAGMPTLPFQSYVLVSPTHMKSEGSELVAATQYQRPVRIVQNKGDVCVGSPASAVEELKKSITAPQVDLAWVDVGKGPLGGPCGPFGPHSFFGIEPLAIQTIAKLL